jgi:hypothetical protein
MTNADVSLGEGFSEDEKHRIDLASVALIVSDFAAVNRLFDTAGLPRPYVRWIDPEEVGTVTQPHTAVYHHWRSHRDETGLPSLDTLAPIDAVSALGNIHIVASQQGKYDFLHKARAATDCSLVGRPIQNPSVSDTSMSPEIRIFVASAYRATVYRKTPMIAIHAANPDNRLTECDRLLLPVASEVGSIDTLLVSLGCRELTMPGPFHIR